MRDDCDYDSDEEPDVDLDRKRRLEDALDNQHREIKDSA